MEFKKAVRKQDRHGHRSGRKNSLTYTSWETMRTRCSMGGSYWDKGIRVCDRWESFSNFLLDMGDRPKNTTIDRINPLGDYEPSNCRWATASEQSRNRSDRVYFEHDGRRMLLTDWAKETGIAFSCLFKRVHTLGWPFFKAIGTPSLKEKRNAIR